jgi:hypothetical protein
MFTTRYSTKFAKFIFTSLLISLFIFSNLSADVSADIQIDTYEITHGFSTNLNTDINVCGCGGYQDQITISNTGDYDTLFYITSSKPEFLKIQTTQVKIPSKGTAKVTMQIAPNCNMAKQDVLVTIKNSYNVKKDYVVKTNPGNCKNLGAKLTKDKETINPCEPIHFELTVKNVGAFTDTYNFDFGKYSKYASSEHSYATIPAGKSAVFPIKFQMDCDKNGNFTIPVNVYSKKTKMGLKFENDIVIEPNYNFAVEKSPSYFACTDSRTQHIMKLINNDEFENEFDIKIINPAFAFLETKTIKLDAQSSENIVFNFDPNNREIGNHTLKFQITSKVGDVTKEFETVIWTDRCYNPKLYNVEKDMNLCGNTKEIVFTVENTGAIPNEFKVEIEDLGIFDSWKYDDVKDLLLPEPIFLTLQPWEAREIVIDTSKLEDVNAKYKIPIKSTLLAKNISLKESIKIDYTSAYDCHEAKFSPKTMRINYDTTQKHFYIKNVGDTYTQYDVEITQIFEENETKTDMFTFESGNEFNVDLAVNTKQYYTLNIDNTQVTKDKKDYKFNVLVKQKNGLRPAEYNYELTIKQRDKSIFYYAGLWIYNNPIIDGIIVLIILLILLLLFLSFSRPKNVKKKDNRRKTFKKWLLAYIILLILLFAALLVFFPLKSIYPSVTENNTDFEYAMYSGNTQAIDLEPFFQDPDGDTLNYGAKINNTENFTEEQLFNIRFKNAIAFVKAPKNSQGSAEIIFTASDNESVSNSSPFTFNVIRKPIYQVMDYVNFYRYYLLSLGLGLFLLIYIIALYFWSKRSTKRQHLKDKKDKLKLRENLKNKN